MVPLYGDAMAPRLLRVPSLQGALLYSCHPNQAHGGSFSSPCWGEAPMGYAAIHGAMCGAAPHSGWCLWMQRESRRGTTFPWPLPPVSWCCLGKQTPVVLAWGSGMLACVLPFPEWILGTSAASWAASPAPAEARAKTAAAVSGRAVYFRNAALAASPKCPFSLPREVRVLPRSITGVSVATDCDATGVGNSAWDSDFIVALKLRRLGRSPKKTLNPQVLPKPGQCVRARQCLQTAWSRPHPEPRGSLTWRGPSRTRLQHCPRLSTAARFIDNSTCVCV